MIREVLCKVAIDQETQPDGPTVAVVDAYDGCQLACPYCFQWEDPSWSQDILVKTNVVEVLVDQLRSWDRTVPIYIGSRGDPYMALEARYRLTRQLLQQLRLHGVPCFISTKSSELPLNEDLGLFAGYGDGLTICMGQSNLAHFRQGIGPSELPNIRTVSTLVRMGIRAWAFITPVLPGITDVQAMVAALPPSVPVYIDRLRLRPEGASTDRLLAYLRLFHPHLESRYRLLAETGTDPYYDELHELCRREPRVKYVFGEH